MDLPSHFRAAIDMVMRSLLLFFTLAFGISWLLWSPLYVPAFGSFELPYHHALGAYGPLIAAFIVTARDHGYAGMRSLVASMVQFRSLPFLLVAIFGPFILLLIAAWSNSFVSGTGYSLHGFGLSMEFPQFTFTGFLFYNILTFGIGEETGWRGVALPRLQERYSPIVASTILAGAWAIWHWPLFLYRPGYTSMDPAGIAGWLISLLTGSVLLTWMFNGSRGSILVCAIFHATIDVAFTSDMSDKNVVQYLGMAITIWGVVIAALLWSGRSRKIPVTDLSRPPSGQRP